MNQGSQSSSGSFSIAESIVPYTYDSAPIIDIKKNGDELLKSSHYLEAYEVYSQALPLIYQNSRPEIIEPTTEEVLLGMAKCALSLQKYNESKHYCYEVLNSNPNQPTALLYLALIYKQEGNDKKSEKYIKLAYSCSQDTDNNSDNHQIQELYRQYSEQSNQNSQIPQPKNVQDSNIIDQLIASTILGSASTAVVWQRRTKLQNSFLCLWNSTCIFGGMHLKNWKYKFICIGIYLVSVLLAYFYK